jgi:hypothetical protein
LSLTSGAVGLFSRADLTEDKGGEDSVDRVLYALSFLYKAMQRSYESGGMGTELMADLFKGLCNTHPQCLVCVCVCVRACVLTLL